MKFRALAALAATFAATAFAVAAPLPAFASGTPVTASATVNSSITFSGLAPTVTFPATDPGNTANVPAAEVYSVTTNDAAGFTLTVTPGNGSGFSDGHGHFITNDNLWFMEKQTTAPNQVSFLPSGTAPVQIDKETTAGAFNYTENWNLAIPVTAPAGSYSQTLTYLVIGN